MGTALAKRDSTRLATLEARIQKNAASAEKLFVEIGTALSEIRDSRLYRETHKTFAAYCRERWNFTDSRARQLIAAAKSVTSGNGSAATEREARRQIAAARKERREKLPGNPHRLLNRIQRARHEYILEAFQRGGLKDVPDEEKASIFGIVRADLEWYYSRGSKLRVVPLELDTAKAFVRKVHRHHPPPSAHRFSLGVLDNKDRLCGVAMAETPKARMTATKRAFDGIPETLEVTRVASDGTPNACSALYRAVVRVAREMGYKRVQTFTLGRENGASLNAAGFTKDRTSPGGSWNGPKRPRTDKHPTDPKTLWVIDLRPQAHSD